MYLQRKLKQFRPTSVVITILPVVALFPILIEVISKAHRGGIDLVFSFITAALHPSINSLVINSAWKGLKTTIATAIISWAISTIFGVCLGLIRSKVFWKTCECTVLIATTTRRILAIPRAIHEILWGMILLEIFVQN